MIKLEIENKTYEVEDEIFRRIITMAQFSVRNIRKREGNQLPAIDKQVEQLILNIRSTHRNMQ